MVKSTVLSLNNEPAIVKCSVNNVNVSFEIDTGSHISTITKDVLKLFSNVKIRSTNTKAKSYSGNTIKFLGEVDLNVTFKGNRTTHTFLVVDSNSVSLLGRDACNKLEIKLSLPSNNSDVRNVSVNQNNNCVLKEFEHFLSDDFKSNVTQTVSLDVKSDAKPVFCRARTVPVRFRELVKTELSRLESLGIITKVYRSEWATPIVNVLKRDNTVRICGDYSVSLNKHLNTVQYPLPSIDDVISRVGGAKVFSVIDLAFAFLQVKLDEQSRELTTINTSEGLYQYKYLPYGLCSSPSLFQSFICKTLNGIDNVVIYQDDILILTRTHQEHNFTLRKVLTALFEAGLKINRKKCRFFTESVCYLGHVFDLNGVHPNPEKMKAIVDAPKPCDVKQVQSFVGLCNFYNRFIPNFTEVLAPLYKLIQKNVKFTWGQEQEKSFQTLKKFFSSDKVLHLYDPTLETLLETDSSSYGIAAVLMQRKDKYSSWYPVQYASRTLNCSERNYSNIEREALSVVFGCEKYKKFLLGTSFTIRNDQQPLRKLLAFDAGVPTTCSARLQRWALRLSQFKYNLEYSKGENNVHSDCLSRLPLPQTVSISEPYELIFTMSSIDDSPINCSDIQRHTDSDPDLSDLKRCIKFGFPNRKTNNPFLSQFRNSVGELTILKGCILFRNRVLIPKSLRNNVLNQFHEGHPGICAMKSMVRSLIWYPNIDSDIERLVKNCSQCQATARKPPQTRSVEWPKPPRPWSRIHIDHFFFDNHIFLIVVDALSKYIECEIVRDTSVAETIEALRLIFSRHGLCDTLVSDNASCFTAYQFKEFLHNNCICHLTSPPYVPSANGLAERGVRTIKELLKKNVQGSLKSRLSKVLMYYRSVPHSITGIPPCIALNNRKYINLKDRINPNYSPCNVTDIRSKNVPQLDIGDSVLALNLRDGPKWYHATVVEKLAINVYNVHIHVLDTIWKRHLHQLIPTPNNHDPKTNSNDIGNSSTTAVPTVRDSPVPNNDYRCNLPSGFVNLPVPNNCTEDPVPSCSKSTLPKPNIQENPRRSVRVKKPVSRYGFDD